MGKPLKIFFISGENSGDQPAGRMIRELRKIEPDCDLAGLGGPKMQEAGMDLLYNMVNELAIVGLVEVMSKAPTLWKVYRLARRYLERERPDAVVLIDYPGFNLGLIAPIAKRLGIPVIYYIVPQVWAWHRSRIEKFRKFCDLMIPILPFEEKLLRREGIEARYLGNPKLDLIVLTMSRQEVFERFQFDPSKKLIGMLPGSRKREVRALLPVMLEAARRMLDLGEPVQFVLPRSETIPIDLVDTYLAEYNVPVKVVDKYRFNVRAAMDFAWIKSGTSTLEGALLGVPFAIIYKVNYITAWLARRILNIPFLGLPNIIAGDLVVPELLQEQATAQNLADCAMRYLHDTEAYEEMRLRLQRIREQFGPPGSARRVAEAIVAHLRQDEHDAPRLPESTAGELPDNTMVQN